MATFLRLRFLERVNLTEDLAIFRFQPELPLQFIPGQYITIGIEQEGKRILRPFSVFSAPHQEILELLIELVPEGQLTPILWQLQPGAELFYRERILGKFVLQEETPYSRHLMLATVTGCAPYMSIVRDLHHRIEKGERMQAPDMLILHGASYASELGMVAEEFQSYAQRYSWLHYTPTVSRPKENPDWHGEIGRVEDVVRKWADNLGYTADVTVAYACGHPGMIQNVKEILQRARFERTQIKEERYFTLPRKS